MKIPYFQVDVFTRTPGRGNPAGVCLLPDGWLPDDRMQTIAHENGLSETAFVIHQAGRYGLRWFTPKVEMDLCGHATVAPAHVLFRETRQARYTLEFDTQSGILRVDEHGDRLTLDFPSRPPVAMEPPGDLPAVMGMTALGTFRARDFLFIYESEEQIRSLKPDFDRMAAWDCLGTIVTAPGRTVDFVSRFFAPGAGVPEDPVTGSAHSTLIPYWSRRLGKKDLHALQVSERGGELFCRDSGDRVKISGEAVTWFRGEIDCPGA